MVSTYFYFTIFLIILYSLGHKNSRSAVTASVIRQIWTGSCRMGCRPAPLAEYDGLSGLSGMIVQIPEQDEPARTCVCESCPCEFIENVVYTVCRPITGVYTGITNTVSNCANSMLNEVYGACDHVSRVLDCRGTCRRQAQLVNSRSTFNSSENFTIVERQVEKRPPLPSVSRPRKTSGAEIVPTVSESANKESRTKKLTEPSGSDTGYSVSPSASKSAAPQETKKGKASKEKHKKSKKQVEPTKSEEHNTQETSKPGTSVLENCSKCAELGKVCIGGCPSAEEKRRKNKK